MTAPDDRRTLETRAKESRFDYSKHIVELLKKVLSAALVPS
jgi:hypothetical protein